MYLQVVEIIRASYLITLDLDLLFFTIRWVAYPNFCLFIVGVSEKDCYLGADATLPSSYLLLCHVV